MKEVYSTSFIKKDHQENFARLIWYQIFHLYTKNLIFIIIHPTIIILFWQSYIYYLIEGLIDKKVDGRSGRYTVSSLGSQF